MSDLYRLVYASKNLIAGDEDEAAAAIAQILSTSQRNNAAVDVTGALLFNKGAFAQVLEGPRQGVEATFERIQQDDRHSDVTVLQCGPVDGRAFGNWSMAFVGRSSRGQALWNGLASKSGFDLSRLNGDDVFAMLHGLVVEEEGIVPSPVARPAVARPTVAVPVPPRDAALDVARLRVEPANLRPTAAAAAMDAGPDAAMSPPDRAAPPIRDEPVLAVLRASLRSERLAAVELRGVIDDLRVAQAQQAERIETMARERDAWAERVRSLAAALNEAADLIAARAPAASKAA